jgi:AcrR family transcriptional regulator
VLLLDVPEMKKLRPRKEKIPPLDERVLRSKKAVLATTYKLLSEAGLGGVSVDEVSKRSGVAKTTIYRHWPSRSALLLDACAKMASKPEPPETGGLQGDLEFLAAYIAGRLPTALWASVLPSIIDAAERDPQLAAVQARIHSEMRNVFRLVIERAQQRGEISRSIDSAELIAAILGPLFYRRWFSREPLNERFVKNVVARAIASSRPS